ncbi:MAG: hypothetical protein IIY27_02770 [Aeriscardovia sp.]|nr:hypothetical protein [Aeriscardovia sp.]
MDRQSPPSGKAPFPREKIFKISRIASGALFSVLAVVFFVLSASSSILRKARSEISASLSSSSPYLVSVPGLLSLTGSPVTISAFSSAPICVAVGQSGDAQGWIGSDSYTQINGLSTWKQLRTRPDAGEQSYPEQDPVSFQDSDMWEKVECGKTMGFVWSPGPDESLILFNPSQSNVILNLGWKRVKDADLAAPYAFFGCICVVLAAISFEFSRLKKLASSPSWEQAPSPDDEPGKTPRWAQDQLALEKRRARIMPRTVKSTKVFKIREKSEEDDVSTQVMDLSALRGVQIANEDPKAQKPSLFGSEPPSFPVASSPIAAGTVFSVTSSKESDPSSKRKGPAIVDKSSVNLLAKTDKDGVSQLHPESEDLGAYFKRLREEKKGEEKHEKKA